MHASDDFERFHNRKNPRLRDYNYCTPNYYFITICTHEKKWLFGKPGTRNTYGDIAYSGLVEICRHFSGVFVDKAVIMPNHIHAIIVLTGNDVHLSDVIGQYKAFVTKSIHRIMPNIPVWQTSFHDHVIRSQQSYEKIWSYIETNPIKWQEDCYMQE